MRLGLCLSGVVLGVFSQPLRAFEKSPTLSEITPRTGPPKLEKFVSPELKDCLRDLQHTGVWIERNSQWQISCPVAELIDVSRNLRTKPSKKNLSDSVVLARAAIHFIADRRAQLLGPQAKPSEAFLAQSETSQWLEKEKIFFDETEALIQEISEWLLPQILGFQKPKASPLFEEAAYFYLKILGESWRFDKLLNFLEEHGSKVGDGKKSTSHILLKDIIFWVQSFGPDAVFRENAAPTKTPLQEWPLRLWVLKRLMAQRSPVITGNGGESEFFLWHQSLFLQAPPQTSAEKKIILQYLQDLWIAFPKLSHGTQIRELSKLLGLQGEFQPLPLKDYSLDQLMTRAKAQVRALDSLGALRTMKRVRLLPAESLSSDEVWDALTYHVRVLRLLDERPQISNTLKSYLSFKDFQTLPHKGFKNQSEAQKFFSRLHELARLYWNYDDPQKALAVVDKIVSLNQVLKSDYFLGPALVIRARIAEQSTDRVRALDLMDQALNSKISGDLTLDLLWRKVFLQFDRVHAEKISADTLFALMEPLKRFSDRGDLAEKSKWNYWQGRFHALANRESEAVKFFKITYELDLFSYYSNLAGVELLKREIQPDNWKPLASNQRIHYDQQSWDNPNWELFVSHLGTPSAPIYRDLARAYLLVRVGELDLAKQALPDLDRMLWTQILSSKVSWKNRRELARTVAFLRKSMNDPMGALRVAEIARQASGPEYEQVDYLNLYPLPYWGLIEKYSQQRSLNPQIVASLIRQESAFNPEAKSWANAIGLMQIIPPVADEEARLMGLSAFQPEQLYVPEMAINLGTHHLSRLVTTFESSWICAIASYNAGTPPVKKWLSFYSTQIPESFIERIPFLETRNYVKSILRNHINYSRVYGPLSENLDVSLLLKMPPDSTRSPSEL